MKNMDCCIPMSTERDPRYTQGKDWSLEDNRPHLCSKDECDATNTTTEAKIANTGLVLRKPL